MQRTLSCPFFRKAFGWCVPIGGLGGLIGLGGGEFRLPILMHSLGFDARSAIPLNLTVSLITLAVAMIARGFFVPLAAIVPHLPEVIGLAAGGMLSAFWGAGLVKKLSARRLVQVVAPLLGGRALGIVARVHAIETNDGYIGRAANGGDDELANSVTEKLRSLAESIGDVGAWMHLHLATHAVRRADDPHDRVARISRFRG